MVSWDQHRVDEHQSKFAPKLRVPSEGVDLELPLHRDIEAELKARRLYYVHSRTDKKTTNQLGVTDFVVAMPGGSTLWMEAKRKNGKLSTEQNVTRHLLLAANHWHAVVYSMADVMALLDAAKN